MIARILTALRRPTLTGDPNQDLYRTNIHYLYLLSIFRSLYFIIPVWVSMELRFISLTQIALIEMVILSSSLILELPTGALADMIGRKTTITISFFISALAYVLFAYADSFSWFLVAGLGFGLGDALLSGALEALIFDTLKQSGKEEAFAEISNKNQLLFNYSIFFAIIVGGVLFGLSYHLPALLTALAFVAAGYISTRFIEPAIDSEVFTLRNYIRQTKLGFKELFRTKQARDISLFYILVGSLTWPIVISFKNFALVDLGINEQNMGFILAFVSVAAVQLLHVLIQKNVFKNPSTIFLLPALSLSIIFPLSYFYNTPVIIGLIFVALLNSSMRWNVIGKLSHQCYSSKNRATAISSLSMMISLTYAASLGIFAFFNTYGGNAVRNTFLIMGACSIVFLLPIAWKLKHKYQDGFKITTHE